MKNPLVVFTGAALATLAALAGLKMTDWPAGAPEASKATEVTSEAPKPSSGEAEKPAEKPAETAAVQPSEPPQAEVPKAETPAPETPAAEPPAAAPAKPELDTVRVEADGQAVVAGRAEPGAEVSLKLGDKVLGKGMANADGAWVVVPDSPLPKGAHELTIEQKAADGATSAAEKSIAVAVPEKPGQQAMVALTEPGAATKVLQAGGGTEQPAPAQAEKPAETAPQQTAEAPSTPQPEQAPAASAPATEPAAEPPAGETVQKTAEAPPAGEVVQKSAEAPAASEPTQKPAESAGAPAAEPPSQTQEMAAVEAKPAEPAVGATQPAETVAPKAAEPPAKTADVPLRLDAVDYNDKGDIIFSGRAKPGTAVRLYVDNGGVGDAVVDSAGNWSFAGNDIIAPGTHTLRADQIDGSGKVVARIELPFQREDAAAVAALNAPAQPEPQPQLAPQPEATQTQPVPQPTQPETTQAEPAPQPAQPEKTEAQPAAPQTTEIAKAEPEAVTPAPSAPQPSTEQPSTEQQPAEQPSTEQQPAEQPSTGQQPAESQAPEKTEEVAAAPQPEPEVEAKPAEPDKPRSGKVVIQPGNNLWKLSRVIYGRGINFTVIYDANKEQIRDPDLIYPGQIFAIPNATPPESIDPKRREPLTSAEGGAAQ